MMSNRREMLCQAAGALTGLASIGCGLGSPVFAQAPQRRREVVVHGKRVRTVDLHAHCHVPEANALMGLKVQLQSLIVSPERIKVMDEQGIDIEALSLNPIFWYKAEPDLAGQVVKLQNEKLAEICAAQPDRFVGLAPRLAPYPERFGSALARVRAGEHTWLARPMIDSYHTVWFELHEDLIGLAGLTRAGEAAAGRAE